MASFWSRLVSWLRGSRPEDVSSTGLAPAAAGARESEPPDIPAAAPSLGDQSPDVAAAARPPTNREPEVSPVETRQAPREVPTELPAPVMPTGLRIGIDFGTSTTQVAYYMDGREPQLIRLEAATDYMPSYYAKDPAGADRFGVVAQNLPENVHSVKPLLVDDVEIPGLGHPSKVAHLMLAEVVRRTIEHLRAQQLIPAKIDQLEVATNLGCTPRFQLDARTLLRDVARRAGLQVSLASLIEEPVAAAYEVMLSGMVSNGRVLIVDMGGGTLDIAVVKISGVGQSFELFASGGYNHAGDAFTQVIVDQLIDATVGVSGHEALTRADATLLWQRAEAAKQTLSVRRSAVVALGGIADHADQTIELSRDWFYKATGNLRVRVKHDVTNVYRLARLVLDRGGKLDPAPGTVDFDEPSKGRVRRLTEVGLEDDAIQHIDHVILVGGATNMPMIEEMFRGIFADQVIQPEVVGIDRSSIVALGLSRPKPSGMSNLRFPSWGVSVAFARMEGETEVPVYEPFAPSFAISSGVTSTYSYELDVPDGAHSASLVFRPIGGSGTRWPGMRIPPATTRLTFQMDLFGAIQVLGAGKIDLLASLPEPMRAPWSPAESDAIAAWLPPWRKPNWWTDVPVWDMRNDK